MTPARALPGTGESFARSFEKSLEGSLVWCRSIGVLPAPGASLRDASPGSAVGADSREELRRSARGPSDRSGLLLARLASPYHEMMSR